jgi:hypothetical protein
MNRKREKLKQLGSYYLKFLKDGITLYGVQNICNVYLKHHSIKMGIQNCSNTMNNDFITFSNYQPELIW